MSFYEGKPITAHRHALILMSGINPLDMVAAHGPCHNKLCVNPHPVHGMGWRSFRGNAKDRHRDGTMLKGEVHKWAKLSEQDVLNIYKDTRSQNVIAGEYRVNQTSISKIKLGKSWSWLTGHSHA